MINENQIEDTLKSLFENIRFNDEPSGLYDPLRYMIGIGGKRVRPRLCLTAYALFRDSFDEKILEPAAALEIFHSFTLIHDDIMDKSDMRRGVPTVYRKWDSNTAIISGDVMSIDSYRRIAMAPASVLPEVLDLFTTTAAQVCEGQQYDMDFENTKDIPMESYMKMIGLKTAVLIACSAKLGAIIAGADSRASDLLYKFGYDLGLAFQITDDYLDTYGDPSVFGKKIGGDIIQNEDVTWSASLTASMIKSKVTKLYDGQDIIWYDPTGSDSRCQYLYREGESTLAYYGYEWAGVDPATGQSVYYVNEMDESGNIDPTAGGDFMYNDRAATYDYGKANEVILGDDNPKI